jgi:hypothetical protein
MSRSAGWPLVRENETGMADFLKRVSLFSIIPIHSNAIRVDRMIMDCVWGDGGTSEGGEGESRGFHGGFGGTGPTRVGRQRGYRESRLVTHGQGWHGPGLANSKLIAGLGSPSVQEFAANGGDKGRRGVGRDMAFPACFSGCRPFTLSERSNRRMVRALRVPGGADPIGV